MTFLFSEALWLLATVPALLSVYALLLRRREKHVLRYSCITQLRQAAGSSLLARHAPALLILLAIGLLLVASARPAVVSARPDGAGTIVFAVDVSYSMAAQDVQPTRLAAAQALVTRFLKEHPGGVRIGLVAFGQYADLVQAPTPNYADVITALQGLRFEYGSGLGTGISAALVTLAPETDLGYKYDLFGEGRSPLAAPVPGESPSPPGRTASRGRSGAVVLLSDGGSTSGMPAMLAAQIAARERVPVFSVGMGRTNGVPVAVGNWRFDADFLPATLQRVASTTQAAYFQVDDAARLETLGRTLSTALRTHAESDVSALFAAVAAVLLISGGLWSISQRRL